MDLESSGVCAPWRSRRRQTGRRARGRQNARRRARPRQNARQRCRERRQIEGERLAPLAMVRLHMQACH